MIARKKKAEILMIAIFVLLLTIMLNVIFQWVDNHYLINGFLLFALLQLLIKPTYTDFNFEIKWVGLNELAFVTPTWSFICEEIDLLTEIPKITLFKGGKKTHSCFLPPTPFPHRILLFAEGGLDKVDLLIVSPSKISRGSYYEEIPYGGFGIVVHFIAKGEIIVLEIIKRKGLFPWYKVMDRKFFEKQLEDLEKIVKTNEKKGGK